MEMIDLITKQKQRSRFAKMLSTSGFNSKFEICKTAVLDLKRELKQYLDQEAQDKMEKSLEASQNLQIDMDVKLDACSSST